MRASCLSAGGRRDGEVMVNGETVSASGFICQRRDNHLRTMHFSSSRNSFSLFFFYCKVKRLPDADEPIGMSGCTGVWG